MHDNPAERKAPANVSLMAACLGPQLEVCAYGSLYFPLTPTGSPLQHVCDSVVHTPIRALVHARFADWAPCRVPMAWETNVKTQSPGQTPRRDSVSRHSAFTVLPSAAVEGPENAARRPFRTVAFKALAFPGSLLFSAP